MKFPGLLLFLSTASANWESRPQGALLETNATTHPQKLQQATHHARHHARHHSHKRVHSSKEVCEIVSPFSSGAGVKTFGNKLYKWAGVGEYDLAHWTNGGEERTVSGCFGQSPQGVYLKQVTYSCGETTMLARTVTKEDPSAVPFVYFFSHVKGPWDRSEGSGDFVNCDLEWQTGMDFHCTCGIGPKPTTVEVTYSHMQDQDKTQTLNLKVTIEEEHKDTIVGGFCQDPNSSDFMGETCSVEYPENLTFEDETCGPCSLKSKRNVIEKIANAHIENPVVFVDHCPSNCSPPPMPEEGGSGSGSEDGGSGSGSDSGSGSGSGSDGGSGSGSDGGPLTKPDSNTCSGSYLPQRTTDVIMATIPSGVCTAESKKAVCNAGGGLVQVEHFSEDACSGPSAGVVDIDVSGGASQGWDCVCSDETEYAFVELYDQNNCDGNLIESNAIMSGSCFAFNELDSKSEMATCDAQGNLVSWDIYSSPDCSGPAQSRDIVDPSGECLGNEQIRCNSYKSDKVPTIPDVATGSPTPSGGNGEEIGPDGGNNNEAPEGTVTISFVIVFPIDYSSFSAEEKMLFMQKFKLPFERRFGIPSNQVNIIEIVTNDGNNAKAAHLDTAFVADAATTSSVSGEVFASPDLVDEIMDMINNYELWSIEWDFPVGIYGVPISGTANVAGSGTNDSGSDSSSSSTNSSAGNTSLLLAILLPVLFIFVLCIGVLYCYRTKKHHQESLASEYDEDLLRGDQNEIIVSEARSQYTDIDGSDGKMPARTPDTSVLDA
eukprot:CAMPEP_0197541060 /NCGR_PEP_ID=MMETSP1318-20131121/66951_1 /TAXON_ID=552666 /ORGANISM="Partenskyella glossopodia, Strain RCC365" /LENGTH=771 /DNA_ID=CAMNT_0043100195 /DNA_START=111 /DNA_END=2426 /DNA_ORIENTATION=-